MSINDCPPIRSIFARFNMEPVACSQLLDGVEPQIIRAGKDHFERTLALIFIDGQDIGNILIAEGLARKWSGKRENWCSTGS